MYTHLYTVEWDFLKKFSTEKINYFQNRIDDRYLAESKTSKGTEDYFCSYDQVRTGNLGIYLGCIRENPSDPNQGKHMTINHDHDMEYTLVLNDEKYL